MPQNDAKLTPREMDILRLLSEGKSGEMIATELQIAPMTVRTHVRNILAKLRVHSRLEAVALALKNRLIVI